MNVAPVDTSPFDFTVKANQKLKTRLYQNIDTQAAIRHLAQMAGVDLGHVNFSQGVKDIWHELLIESRTQENIRTLLNTVAAQKKALKKPIEKYLSIKVVVNDVEVEANTLADIFIEPKTQIRMLRVPGGHFQMGASYSSTDITPHWVTLSSFWLGETHVTNKQYKYFLTSDGHSVPHNWRANKALDNHPVVGVNWRDTQDFCRWLSDESNYQFTLPSEAQWEFAARGTTNRTYPWGDGKPNSNLACFKKNNGAPSPVGSYPAGKGPFGHLDLAGNVRDWCRDYYNKDAYEKRKGKSLIDPIDRDGSDWNVARGGSFDSNYEELLAFKRQGIRTQSRSSGISFRIARVSDDFSLPPPKPEIPAPQSSVNLPTGDTYNIMKNYIHNTGNIGNKNKQGNSGPISVSGSVPHQPKTNTGNVGDENEQQTSGGIHISATGNQEEFKAGIKEATKLLEKFTDEHDLNTKTFRQVRNTIEELEDNIDANGKSLEEIEDLIRKELLAVPEDHRTMFQKMGTHPIAHSFYANGIFKALLSISTLIA